MKFENTTVTGIENAIIGLRLPMSKSFEDAKSKSDSVFIPGAISQIKIGDDDLRIINNLLKADDCGRAGEPNSKFMRMIHVQVAITAPLYWWKEFDTYKVGTVANSTSTMHKLATTPITKDCFEMDDYAELDNGFCTDMWNSLIEWLEGLRQKYNETKVKAYWKELIRLLPESWLQTRMIDCNYATLRNIYAWRRGHKLTEWHKFCDWICTLPLHELITAGVEIGNDAKS
jgi:hypothetical protein